MSIDIMRAIKAPWQNGGGFWRMFLGGLVWSIPILGFVSQGYLMEYMRKISEGKDGLENLFGNGSQSFIRGLKYFIGLVVLSVPVYSIIAGLCIISFISTKGHPSIFIETLISALNILFMFYILALSVSFCVDFKIDSFLNLKAGILIIKKEFIKFLTAFGCSIAVSFLYTALLAIITFIFLPLSIIFIKIFPVVLIIYILLIAIYTSSIFALTVSIMNIMGQFAAESEYFAQLKQQNTISKK